MQINLNTAVKFESRHNGPTEAEVAAMLEKIGASSLTELINQTVPQSIQLERPLQLPAAQLESEFLKNFKKLACNRLSATIIYKILAFPFSPFQGRVSSF